MPRKVSGLVGLVALVVAAVVVARNLDGDLLGRSWRSMVADPGGVALALAGFAIAFLLRARAWRLVLPGLPLGHSLAGIHLALGANHVLPLRLGEPMRVVSVVRRAQVPFEAAAASTVTLRAADSIAVVAVGLVLGPAAFSRLLGWWGWALTAVVVAVGVLGGRWLWRVRQNGSTSVTLPGPQVFGLTTIAWLFEAIVVWQSARWAGIALDPGDAVLVTTVAVAAQVAAIAPSGFGTYEAASVAAYAALGHDADVALVAGLTAHALKTAYSLVTGAVAVVAPAPGMLGRLRLGGTQPDESTTAPPPAVDAPVVFFMPALDEEASVAQCVRRVPTRVRDRPVHVWVIDDGSADRTATVAKAAGAAVISFDTRRGLGAGVRHGLHTAAAEGAAAVVFCDADGEYAPEEVERLVGPILDGHADYVVGSRFLGEIEHMRPERRLGNRVLTRALSFVARRPISDGQSGYRAFSPGAAAAAEVIHDFNYAQVLTLDLLAKGYRYAEVPISYRFRTTGESFVRLGHYLRRVVPAVYRELNAA